MSEMYLELTGLTDLIRGLERFKRTLRNRILRQAAVKVGRIMAKAMKQCAPREFGTDEYSRQRAGLLKKSMGFKVTISKGGSILVIAGPRRGFRKVLGVRIRGKNKGKEVAYDPAKTAHLVDKGTIHAAAKPFRVPALEASKAQVLEIVASTIRAGLARLDKA